MAVDVKFKISKFSNLFFFVSNLGEWHFSCRKSYNKVWLEKTGPLTEKENDYLREFSELMKKYGFEYRSNKFMYLGQFFLSPVKNENQIWKEVENFVEEKEFELIKKTFSVFEGRFEKIWEEERLREWQRKLELKVDGEGFKNLLKKVAFTLKYNKSDNTFGVSLIGAPDKNWGPAGGANLNSNDITLEVPLPKMSGWNVECALSIILHEIAHVFLDNSSFREKISKIVSLKDLSKTKLLVPEKPNEEIVREIVLELIAPSGYFANQYFKDFSPKENIERFKDEGEKELLKVKNGKEGNLHLITHYIVWRLYSVVAFYYGNEKPFDKNIINKVTEFFE